jgi:S1-C subfamily serine protease
VKQGDRIQVIGYPLSQTKAMLTAGVIGSIINGRMQIDALINPGNSGGPLLDESGKMIGVIDSILYSGTPGSKSSPISRAIPLTTFSSLAEFVLKGEHKLLHSPELGVIYTGGSSTAILDYSLDDDEKRPSGAMARYIFENSVVSTTDISKGDIITEVNGCKIDNYGECKLKNNSTIQLDYLLDSWFWGDSIQLKYWSICDHYLGFVWCTLLWKT